MSSTLLEGINFKWICLFTKSRNKEYLRRYDGTRNY